MSFPYKIIDLSHVLEESIPTWDGGCGFQLEILEDYETGCRVQGIKMEAGVGTHMDAPAHFRPGGAGVMDLLAPGVVIDVSKAAHEDFCLARLDVEAFEITHGAILPGSFVMIRTGWDRYWKRPEKYRLFPAISKEAAECLLERGVAGLGVDTLSPDRSGSGYPVHEAFLGQGKCLVENVANLGELPPISSFILALPLKIKGATEAPVRLVAFLNGCHQGSDIIP